MLKKSHKVIDNSFISTYTVDKVSIFKKVLVYRYFYSLFINNKYEILYDIYLTITLY